jgi:hypothetical protein
MSTLGCFNVFAATGCDLVLLEVRNALKSCDSWSTLGAQVCEEMLLHLALSAFIRLIMTGYDLGTDCCKKSEEVSAHH